ncbi:hypothetical protein LCGC14_0338040 [marine sediment metagenome]|uniref:Uncharacterized protein n=1 Tax=marine sediment metagenome TaxID=412755 RepID=A0A0F9TEF6_9ZZZZ
MNEVKTFKVTARCEKCDNVQDLLVGADDEFDAIKLTTRAICRICGPPLWEVRNIEEMEGQDCFTPKLPEDNGYLWN